MFLSVVVIAMLFVVIFITLNTDKKEILNVQNGNNSQNNNILVVYFSWPGNTKNISEYIAKETNADLFEIIPTEKYPHGYVKCTEVALKERDNNERPKISNLPEIIKNYNTIIIGFPIWWHTSPMIIGTFLESYDLTGVNIYPFTQSASMNKEQFNNAMEFIKDSAGNGIIHEGLFANSNDKNTIDNYLKVNNLKK